MTNVAWSPTEQKGPPAPVQSLGVWFLDQVAYQMPWEAVNYFPLILAFSS